MSRWTPAPPMRWPGMNYTLRNLGDGFAMFDGATLIKDYVSEDYLVMSSYAAMFGGVDGNGLPHLTSANSRWPITPATSSTMRNLTVRAATRHLVRLLRTL